jgi:hypothetical protein
MRSCDQDQMSFIILRTTIYKLRPNKLIRNYVNKIVNMKINSKLRCINIFKTTSSNELAKTFMNSITTTWSLRYLNGEEETGRKRKLTRRTEGVIWGLSSDGLHKWLKQMDNIEKWLFLHMHMKRISSFPFWTIILSSRSVHTLRKLSRRQPISRKQSKKLGNLSISMNLASWLYVVGKLTEL